MTTQHLEIVCSRCGNIVQGMKFIQDQEGELGGTSGYYEVSPDKGWSKYARPDEKYLCDNCMFSDLEYQKDYLSGDIAQ